MRTPVLCLPLQTLFGLTPYRFYTSRVATLNDCYSTVTLLRCLDVSLVKRHTTHTTFVEQNFDYVTYATKTANILQTGLPKVDALRAHILPTPRYL